MSISSFSIPGADAQFSRQISNVDKRRAYRGSSSSELYYSSTLNRHDKLTDDVSKSTSDGSDTVPKQKLRGNGESRNIRKNASGPDSRVIAPSRQDYLDMQLEVSRLRSELNEVLQERSDLLATRLDNEMAIAALRSKRAEEQLRSSSRLRVLEETLSSTMEVAKARRDQLESTVAQQSE